MAMIPRNSPNGEQKPSLRISVVLATYQGERYLLEQLQSLAQQERLPDELIVVDDSSHDSTRTLLTAFAQVAPFPIRLHYSRHNQGSTRSFELGCQLCSGDWIFLCDQDDIWDTSKIRLIEQFYQTDPTAQMIFTDADLIQANGESLGRTLWRSLGYAGEPLTLRRLIAANVVTGATIAFHRMLIPAIFPIPMSWTHDAWLAYLAVERGVARPLKRPLIRYRLHPAQQIGIRRGWRGRSAEHFVTEAANWWEIAGRIEEHFGTTEGAMLAHAKARFCEQRASLRRQPIWRRPWSAARLWLRGDYHRLAHGTRNFLADAFLL